MRRVAWLVVVVAPLGCDERGATKGGTSQAQRLLQGLSQPGEATGKLVLRPRHLSPAEESRTLARLDLGPPGAIFPTELRGLTFGMGPRALKRLRPGARLAPAFRRKRHGRMERRRLAAEEAPPGSPYERFQYHFTNGKLVGVFAWIHLSRFSRALLEKAVAKWGKPSADRETLQREKYHALRGMLRKEWRLPGARVRLEHPRFELRVRFYFARE